MKSKYRKFDRSDFITDVALCVMSTFFLFFWMRVGNVYGVICCCPFIGFYTYYIGYQLIGGNQIDEYNYLIKKLKDENPERVKIFKKLRKDYRKSMMVAACVSMIALTVFSAFVMDTGFILAGLVGIIIVGALAGAFSVLLRQEIPKDDEKDAEEEVIPNEQ